MWLRESRSSGSSAPRRSRGRSWKMRRARLGDAGAIAGLVARELRVRWRLRLEADRLLSSYSTVHLLFCAGVAVGLCGFEGPQAGGGCRDPNPALEMRAVIFVADWLDAADSAEAASRLVHQLARSMGLRCDAPGLSTDRPLPTCLG